MTLTVPDALQWPSQLLLRERSLEWIPDFNNSASPAALDGTKQFGSSTGGGLWQCALTAIQLRRPEHVQAWLGFQLQLRGGAVPVDVPLFLKAYQPRPVIGTTTTITARAGGWPARAVSGRVSLDDANGLSAGQHFSAYDALIYGWRLYRVESSTAVPLSSGSGALDEIDITFWPPARFAMADDAQLEIDNPRCVMRLSAPATADLERRIRGNPNLEFIEAA